MKGKPPMTRDIKNTGRTMLALQHTMDAAEVDGLDREELAAILAGAAHALITATYGEYAASAWLAHLAVKTPSSDARPMN